MKRSDLFLENEWMVVEKEYNLETEPNNATLFTTGNGYIGVRGSLEEFGSLRIQGCYIRGLIDTIYELPQPFADNIYMKKYYFDEDKLKKFEKQDSIINFADILLVRVKIGDETFFPWEGKLLSWKRTLDIKRSILIREVRWESTKGHITRIKFERFSSFADDHLYCIKVSVTSENHNENIEILSGLDLRTKTNGQRITRKISSKIDGNKLIYHNLLGDTYKFEVITGVCNHFYGENGKDLSRWSNINDEDFLANSIAFHSKLGETYVLEKKIYCITSRDVSGDLDRIIEDKVDKLNSYQFVTLFADHQTQWKKFFEKMDIKISGDQNADISLRFSNYHTAISIARNDAVHSLSAKGLTGETYNNFVWWDCEVYQAPVFFHTVPDIAKNIILYRYGKLDAARQIAKNEKRDGAKFPFTSSVTGFETVWEYARHPFLQIHIVADVAWSVINYYFCSGDKNFLIEYGLEIIWEVARYWASRVTYNNESDRYEINNVTGTDEHHPYVDNNAYTNFLVYFVMQKAIKFYDEFQKETSSLIQKIKLQKDEISMWNKISQKLYLPMYNDTGMIPQFDHYFDLNKTLEIKGGATAKSFQMKESGLYHQSQVIKQPDVMLLFSYINIKFDEEIYKRNWNYYEARCEASSSLSYSVHSISASDMGQPESAYKYFMKSARLDMDDDHNCAWQGIHSACAAGAWLAAVRGIAGLIMREDMIEVNPHMIPWWEEMKFNIVWHGQCLNIALNNKNITIKSIKQNKTVIPVSFKKNLISLPIGKSITFDIGVNGFSGYSFPNI